MGQLLVLFTPQSQAFYIYAAAFILQHSPPSNLWGSLQGKCSECSPAAQLPSVELSSTVCHQGWRWALVSHLARPSRMAISILTAMWMLPAHFWGCSLSWGAIPRWEMTCPQLHKNINVTSAGWCPERMRDAPAPGHRPLYGINGSRKLPLSRHVSWVCALISAFSALYLSVNRSWKRYIALKWGMDVMRWEALQKPI